MYLVSTSSRLVLPIRDEKIKYHPESGAVIDITPGITLQFVPTTSMPDWAKEAVKGLSGFGRGLPIRSDNPIDLDPYSRCGVCDVDAIAIAENWDEATKEFVYARLEKAAGSNFAISAPPAAPKPWEKYDEAEGVEQILYTIELTGGDPAIALRYERENLARADVVEALEAAVAKQNEDVVGVIPA